MPHGAPASRQAAEVSEVHRFVNKTVPFRFLGADLRFHLSHGLFSSFDIDEGTRLLLKSIAQKVDLASLGSVLDAGCGVGVIGICVGRHASNARVVMQDRDALAVAVTRGNCRLNGLVGASAHCRLAFHGLAGGSFDLIVSNVPAKAGAPVLRAFFRHAAGCLSPRGIAAVVIVAPLSSLARDALAGLGCQILHTEETRAYRVFHFTAGSAPRETDELREDLSPYIRGSIRFTRGADDYFLETVYSLADFDTLGRHLELAMDVLEDVPAPRSALIWNPGQGHLAAVIARSGSRAMTVAGRDCLECAITARNLLRLGSPPVAVHCLPSESELVGAVPPGSVDLLVSIPHPIPRVPWQAGLAEAARRILKPGGRLIAVGTSTEIHRLISHPGPLAAEGGRKRAGFRAVVLRTPEGPTPPSQA